MLPDLDTVVPHFQPIINSADQSVFAYEVLARQYRDGGIRSLGPFFEDPAVPDEEKLTLDLHVRKLALQAHAASGSKAKLFINVKPSWVYKSVDDPETFSPLSMFDKYNIDPKNIVIEVTEDALLGDSDLFEKTLADYRRAGCLLAIDDYGKGDSSVERIAYVKPNIIKLDHSIISKTDTHSSFFELCESQRASGTILGFTLLYEGVETIAQLERCVKSGKCYLQGWLFSKANPGFETDFAHRGLLGDILDLHSSMKKWELACYTKILATMGDAVEQWRSLVPDDAEVLAEPGSLHRFAKKLPYYCVRCVVCDGECNHLSPVSRTLRHDTVVDVDDPLGTVPESRIFFQGVKALLGNPKGFLSDQYKNVVTREPVLTYMHKLGKDRFLCIDIMANALQD